MITIWYFFMFFALVSARCGTPDDHSFHTIQQDDQITVTLSSLNETARGTDKIVIPVYFHVIYTSEKGKITHRRIRKQIQTLNEDYAEADIEFELRNVSYHKNKHWFKYNLDDLSNKNYKMYKLKRGTAHTLNIYTISMYESDGLLGRSQFPWHYTNGPARDSVVLDFDSLPGGPYPDYSLGRSATHEIGHWLGLLHTFQGGCDIYGDQITDTRPQSVPNYSCVPKGEIVKTCNQKDFPSDQAKQYDSLVNDLEHDPVHNFLNYPPDQCMNNFTPLQIKRMRKYWNYRLKFNY